MESSHLGEDLLERYKSKQLTPDEVLEVYRHIGECRQCRDAVDSNRQVEHTPFLNLRRDIILDDLDVEEHLAEIQMIGSANKTLGWIDQQIVDAHLAICEECAEEMKQFLAFPFDAQRVLEPLTLWNRLMALIRGVSSRNPNELLPHSVASSGSALSSGGRTSRITMQALAFACIIVLLLLILRSGWFASRPAGDQGQQQLALAQRDLEDEKAKRHSAEEKARVLTRDKEHLTQLAQEEKKNREASERQVALLQQQIVAGATSQFATVGQNLYRDHQGKLVVAVSVADEKWMDPALKGVGLDIPRRIEELNQPSAHLGGNDPKSPTVALLSPRSTFVVSKQPLFRWKQLRSGRYYRLRLQSEAADAVATIDLNALRDGQWEIKVYGTDTSHLLYRYKTNSGTEWNPGLSDKLPPLNPGEAYRWWVEEFDKPAEDPKAIGIRSHIAMFQIADPVVEADYKRAQSQYAGLHLLLGAYYAHAGFIEDARAELKLERNNQAVAARLLKRLPQGP